MELTKEYFDQQLKALNNRMDGLATQDHVDALDQRIQGVTDRMETLPTREEVRALQTTVDEIRETVQRIDKRDVEDSDAHAKNYVNHEHRITRIEKQLKLKPAA
jgi:hypothetical protein